MAITTFLGSHVPEATHTTIQEERAFMLSQGMAVPLVLEYAIPATRRWWQRRQTTMVYEVLWPLGALGECQVVNFYLEGTGTSINTLVPASTVLAYLWGYMAGWHGAVEQEGEA